MELTNRTNGKCFGTERELRLLYSPMPIRALDQAQSTMLDRQLDQ
jgi:hypothetical protein